MSEIDPKALADLIESSGLRFKKNAVSYIFTCPKCDKKEKLYIRRSTGQFICFYCSETVGFKGWPEYALTELLGMSLPDLKNKLYGLEAPPGSGYLTLNLRDFFGDSPPIEPEPIPSFEFPSDFFPIDSPKSIVGAAYLESRGISLDIAAQYRLRYCPPTKRVVFPIYEGERIVGWQARFVGPTEWVSGGETKRWPKIVSCSGMKGDKILMFNERLNTEHCILTEGPIDAIKAHACGGNVAAMGKGVSKCQLNIIRNSGIKKLYIALDPDAASDVQRIAKEMADLELYRLLPPDGVKDLGDCSIAQVKELFDAAPRILPGQIFLFLK